MGTGIVRGLAFCGRLLEVDGRPAKAGRYRLKLALHADGRIGRSSWSEIQDRVDVDAQGKFSVLLGVNNPIDGKQFHDRARWVSVRRMRGAEEGPENAPRVCVVGTALQLTERITEMHAQLQHHAEILERYASGPSTRKLAKRLEALESKTDELQSGDLGVIRAQISELLSQAEAILEEGGRLDQIEDRLEDLDGPDGDIIDVNMRMDSIEQRLQPARRSLGRKKA